MIDFPASPTDGQIFSATNGVVYKYSATYSSWLAQNPTPPLGGTGDFFAYNSSTIALTTTVTALVIAPVVTGNSGGYYNSANGRWTPPAGRYAIRSQGFGFYTSTSTYELQIRKNGSLIVRGDASAAGSNNGFVAVEAVLDANGSDYFEIWGTSSAGVGSTLSSATFQAFPLTGMQGPTGPAGVTQTVFFETGAVATGTTIIPADDTIPQITEGDQYMSLSITPQSATSKLIIDVVWNGSASAGPCQMVAALFQDTTANALAATFLVAPATGYALNLKFSHTMTSGTTSPTTFRVRAGPNAGSTTVTFNGIAAARIFGGVMASSIVIREVP